MIKKLKINKNVKIIMSRTDLLLYNMIVKFGVLRLCGSCMMTII